MLYLLEKGKKLHILFFPSSWNTDRVFSNENFVRVVDNVCVCVCVCGLFILHLFPCVCACRHWLKSSISLLVIMGITWIIGVLAFTQALLAVAYIFTIFVAFQVSSAHTCIHDTVEPPNKGHLLNKGQDLEHQKSLSCSANTYEERTLLYYRIAFQLVCFSEAPL